MKILKVKDKNAISVAIEILNEGGIVVCPTDTVYGFLADATNKKAVENIYKIKERPLSKPLPVFVKNIQVAKKIAVISKDQEKILNKKWPGRFTFVLERYRDIKLYGVDSGTIALRIPKYNFLNNLLEKIDKPLVQTSVNASGEKPLIKIGEIIKQFKDNKINLGLIINAGNLPKKKPSRLIDLSNRGQKVLRY